MDDILCQFQEVMHNSGLLCPELPAANTDTFQRFGMDNDKGRKPCWYILSILPDGFAVGSFGCFKRDINKTWCNRDITLLCQDERSAFKTGLKKIEEKHKLEQQQYWNERAEKAEKIWCNSKLVENSHQYLKSKGIKSFGLHVSFTGDLIIPVLDNENKIHGLQFINPNGEKKFLSGTNKKGHYFLISGNNNIIYIAEGYATAASIYQATDNTAVIAFDAGNLLFVSQAIRKKYPHAEIVFASDNDQFGENNVGVEKAAEAARTIHAKIVVPQFKNLETAPTDFNDLMSLEGLEEVRKQLSNSKDILIPNVEKKRESQASKILELVNNLELFYDKQRIAYATVENNGHQETWRLDSKNFYDWLSHQYWCKHHKVISRNVLQDALATLQGKARFEGGCQEVYTRIAMVDHTIYINLANENWEVIKVTQSGWEVIKKIPIKFTCTANMQALPISTQGGNFEQFWQYVNIPEEYRKLVLAFILECFRPHTPYPILVLCGIPGSAKSTTQELIRMLIDPSSNNLRNTPKKSEDLLVSAANNSVVSFNNVSHLSETQQDDLCCLATGGSFGTRELFTTHNEAVVNIKRPVIMNGIGDLVTAQDLIDRCLIMELPEIDDLKRKTEEEIKEDFDQSYSEIFGALLDILSAVLKELPNVKLAKKPRMADFALLGTALEKVMGWEEGSFILAYVNHRKDNLVSAMEHSPVAIALAHFIEDKICYECSYAQLYRQLSTSQYKPDMAGWPKSPKGLANKIKRQKAALSAMGIEIVFDLNRHEDGYHIHIEKRVKQVQ